jgi:hypothetical protein
MTSPANEMHIFLWQIGTVIPIQSMITHIYMPRFSRRARETSNSERFSLLREFSLCMYEIFHGSKIHRSYKSYDFFFQIVTFFQGKRRH